MIVMILMGADMVGHAVWLGLFIESCRSRKMESW
jgi:hypothetical protein